MSEAPPRVVVLAGPNGAGKTTVSRALLGEQLGIKHFVNADTIARGLSGFDPEGAGMTAGRVMLDWMRRLAARRLDFAFESSLASRSLLPWLRGLRDSGYRLLLVYVWLPSPDLAVARVHHRVREGGHFVADEVVRRRYGRGLANLRSACLPIADAVWLLDGSQLPPGLVASGAPGSLTEHDPDVVRRILR